MSVRCKYSPHETRNGNEPSIAAHRGLATFSVLYQATVSALEVSGKNIFRILAAPIPHNIRGKKCILSIAAYVPSLRLYCGFIPPQDGKGEVFHPFVFVFFVFNEDAKLDVLPFRRTHGVQYEKERTCTSTYIEERLT